MAKSRKRIPNRLITDTLREIRKTRSRFVSILVLSALAVCFLAGLRVTEPDMKLSADRYLDAQALMDLRIVSTMGLTDKDVDALAARPEVELVEGAYTVDALIAQGDRALVVKVHSMSEQINCPNLLQGRMPRAEGEMLVDPMMLAQTGLSIGDVVTMDTGTGDFEGVLKTDRYTIVGVADSPLYISVERGSASLGNGKADAFVLLPESEFHMDYYTDAFVTLKGAAAMETYGEEYETLLERVTGELEQFGEVRAAQRRQDVLDEANEKLADAEQELADAEKDVEKELSDAEAELADARAELDDGWKEYEDGKLEFEQEIADAEQEIADGEKELADALVELTDGEKEYKDGLAELADGKKTYEDGLAEYEDGKKKYEEGLAEWSDGKKKYEDGLAEWTDGKKKYEDGLAEWTDGKKKYEDGLAEWTDGKKKYEDGLAELADARKQIEDGWAEYEAGLEEYQNGRYELDSGWSEYEQGLDELEQGVVAQAEQAAAAVAGQQAQQQAELMAPAAAQQAVAGLGLTPGMPGYDAAYAEALNAAKTTIYEQAYPHIYDAAYPAVLEQVKTAAAPMYQPLEEAYDLLCQGEDELSAAWEILEDARVELEQAEQELLDGEAELEKAEQELLDGEAELKKAEQEVLDGEAELKKAEQELLDAETELETARLEIADGEAELADAKKELDEGWAELEKARVELADGEQELADARKELDKGWKEYEDGLAELADARVTLKEESAKGEKELADALVELTDGEKEYADGLKEYAEGKAEAEEELADAREKIADARQEVEDIGECEWYILDRNTNMGYASYSMDADRMGNLAKVFPLIFFMVAALVCLTTMTRMVEEQRVTIGGMKALGYTRGAIAIKYVGYGVLASAAGSLLGLAVGLSLVPWIICNAWQIMYTTGEIYYSLEPQTSVLACLAAVGTVTVAAWGACASALKAVPAQLMRPKAPPMGKRILLERITPLWRRLSFNYKVTMRNLFRYKKRFWMTVIGIGGCAALIVTAFGLRDSIFAVMNKQFDELYHYHAQVSLTDKITDEQYQQVLDTLDDCELVENCLPGRMEIVTAQTPAYTLDVNLQTVPDRQAVDSLIELRHRLDDGEVVLPDDGAVLTEKLASLLGVTVGDTVTLDGDKRVEVRVADTTEHYIQHYIYMSRAYYEQVMGAPAKDNTLLVKYTDREADTRELDEALVALEGVASIGHIKDTRQTIGSSLSAVDYAVIFVIVCAAALAFVVLYNLTNINITERMRELATLKVLGFHDGELSAYVYRENMFLTVFGVLLGLVMGKYLHQWLILTVEIEMLMFGREVETASYLYAVGLTVLFALTVNLFAHRKLKKLDMVESLKSVE